MNFFEKRFSTGLSTMPFSLLPLPMLHIHFFKKRKMAINKGKRVYISYIPSPFMRQSGKNRVFHIIPKVIHKKRGENRDFTGLWLFRCGKLFKKAKLSTRKNVDNFAFVHKIIPMFSPGENKINIRGTLQNCNN